MTLYEKWTEMAKNIITTKGEAGFWKEYSAEEKKVYEKFLGEYKTVFEGKVKDLAVKFDVDILYFEGFLDGINDSLVESLDVEKLTEESEVKIQADFKKLFFNMLDAKAEYLYKLPQWDAILTEEERKAIQKEWVASKTVVNEVSVGRNDPCPCGSGKKYKKCCLGK